MLKNNNIWYCVTNAMVNCGVLSSVEGLVDHAICCELVLFAFHVHLMEKAC